MTSFEELRKELYGKYGKKEDEKSSLGYEATDETRNSFSDLRSQMVKEYDRSSEVDDKFISTFFTDVNSYLKNSQTNYNGIGYSTASSIYDTQSKTVKDLTSRAGAVRSYLRNNRDKFDSKSYSDLMSQLDEIGEAIHSTHHAFYDAKKYYSQWDSEEDYIRTSTSAIEERQNRYESNKKRIEEIESQLPWIADTFLPNGVENIFLSGEHKALREEMERLELENKKYERGEEGYISKTVDDYYDVTQKADFATGSANRDHNNPTREDLTVYDSLNDSSTWYYDENDVLRDAYGNAIVKDSSGLLVNPNAAQYAVKDRLGIYFGATEKDLEEYMGTIVSGTWGDIIRDGIDGSWNYLEQGEIDIYYYLLNTNGQETADKYLSDMKTELNRRQTLDETGKWNAAYNEGTLLEKIAMNAATIPTSLFSNTIGFAEDAANTIAGKDINPYSFAHSGIHYSQTVRGETAEELDKTNFKIPVIDFTLGDIYQTGMSRLDSALATSVFGGAGVAFLGMGAAEAEAYKLYKQGASADQITLGAFSAGLAEAAWEYVTYGKLKEIKNVGTPGAWAKSVLVQGWNEAFEEAGTEVTNILTNALVMGSQSGLAELYKENEEKAFNTFLDCLKQTVHSAFGGFLSGGGAGAVQATSSYIDTTSQYRDAGNAIVSADGGVDALKNLANEVAGVSDSKMQKTLEKLSGKVSGEAATGKGLVGKTVAAAKNASNATKVGRLYNTVQNANDLANASANQADVAKSLMRKGFSSETANDIAGALVASYNGQDLTKAQQKLLKSAQDSKVVQDAISNIMDNTKSTMGQRSQNIRDFASDIAYGRLAKAYGVSVDEARKMYEGTSTPDADNATESHYEVSTEGKTIDSNGNDIVITGVESIENGKMVLKTENGTIDSSEVAYATEADALVYETVAKMGASPASSWAMIKAFKESDGVSAQAYATAVPLAYMYGKLNYKQGVFVDGKPRLALTEAQSATAFQMGRDDAAASVKATENASTESTISDKNADKKIIFEGFEYSKRKANDVQRASMEAIDMINKMSGLEIHVYQSYKKGGKLYAVVNGKERVAPNGYYTDGNKVYIDINAGNMGEGLMLYTLSHEIGHYIARYNAQDFKTISDFLFEHYGENVPVYKLLEHQVNKLKNSYKEDGKTIPNQAQLEREAQEELVCDMLSRMLADKNAYDKLMEFKQQDLNAFQKLGQAIKRILDKFAKLIGVYDTQNPDFLYAASVENFGEEAFRQLQELYIKAFVQADANFQSAEKNTTEDGGVKYSFGVTQSDIDAYVEAAYVKGNTADYKKYAKVNLRLQEDVADEIDISEYAHALRDNDIRHIRNSHGEASLEKYPVTMQDIKSIPWIVENYDKVYVVRKSNNRTGIMYVKVNSEGIVYYLEQATTVYGNEPLLINKQMVKTGIDDILNLPELRDAITKKQSEAEFLNDLKKAHQVYAQSVNQLHSGTKIAQPEENVNSESVEAMDVEVDAKTESVAPTILKSERTWTESDYVQEREQAAKEIAKAIGVSVKKAKAYIDSVNSIAKMIAEDRVRLDYFSSPGRSSFVSNVEYGGSFDFSTLCKKRRLLTGTFTAIQKALPNTALTADEILKIRNRMKEKGLEVSCGLCYVEGSRANMGQFAKEFLKLYKQYYPDAWQPNMADVNTPDGIEWVRINHPECYEQYEYFWNHYGTLKPGDKNLFASQQKPKLYQLHTEYKGEVLDKFKDDGNVEEKNLNGGIRLQSFSDFEIVHLIDTMQIIMDMSRVGLAGQAYTKVPDFAWALGDTGLKINLSLIAKGVDENGKLIFDDVEGMPIDEAMKLRDRYSSNVGTILVAFNDEQLLAAMADERVDFIIPFHRSQWKKSQYAAMGLPAKTKDYTYMQNEKFIKPQYHEYRGRMVKDKATNYMPNEYWDFSKSGKENAEAYLEMCARNNKRPKFYKFLQNNGDGSYSLKADGSTDGYWKLLIDFKMYDNDGVGSPQMPVKPDFNMDEATRMLNDYSGGHSNFPVAQGIVDDFVNEYKESHKGVQYSDRASSYLDAVKRGDKTTAKKMLDKYAIEQGFDVDEDGAPDLLFHGTDSFGFTKIDTSKSDDSTTFWATPNMGVAGSYYANSNYKIREIGREKVAPKGEKLAYNSSMERAVNAAKPFAAEMGQDLSKAKYVKEAAVMKKAKKTMQKAASASEAVLNGDFSDDIKRIAKNVITASSQGTYGAWAKAINQNKWQQYSETTGVNFAELDLPDNFNPDKSDISKVTQVDPDVFKMMYHIGDVLDDLGRDDYATIKGETIDKNDVIDSYNDIVAEKGIYGFYHKQSNPFEYDCSGAAWNKIAVPNEAKGHFSKDVVTTRQLAEWAFENGYDAIKLDNVVDVGGYALKEARDPATVWAFKNPESQIKSADPITYDDNGDVIPLSERFNQANDDIRHSDRDTESVSNRSLLANAFEGVAQNEIEKNKIREYKGKIDLIEAEERKLSELNEKIKELSFAKGPRDTAAIRDLQFEARQTANRINTYDKQLLRLEASKPLQDVLAREKKQAYQRAEQRGKEAMAAYREKTAKTQRELLERWQESRKKGVEGRHKTAMRHKIKDVVNDLNQYLLKGTKDRHVPIGLQKAVAEALNAVNMDTVGAEERIAKLNDELMKAKTPEAIREISKRIDNIREMGDRMDERLKKLKAAYDEFINSDDPMIANSHDDGMSGHMMTLIVRVGDTPLREMSLSQLQDVYDVYKIVLATIRNANKSFKDNKNREISTRANQVMAEIDNLGVKRGKRPVFMNWVEKFGWDNLKPVYAMEHIGSNGLIDAFENVRAGEDTWARDVTEAREYYLEQSKKYKYDSWDFEKQFKFTSTSGMEFELTLDQIMSLYAYSKRDQAADHLKYGGIVFDPKTEVVVKTKSGIKVKYNVANATSYNISEETLGDITSKLTEAQKNFVDEMQAYLSDVMGGKGNEVSLAMYDVKLFRDKFYFPLKSAHQYMAKAKEQAQGDVKIKNSGFSKETKPHAKNPIVLSSFMDVWANHVNEMSMYHAFVLPMEDFYRIYNYTTPSNNENLPTEGVNPSIENAYGSAATGYIEQMLKDLNGGARSDSTTGFINKMIGLFKKGSVFASLSVVVQQPSAIARAAALVDTKYFIGPKVDHKRHKALWEEVKQYAPVAIIKEMGYFDTNMGKSTQDFILGKEYSSFKEKMSALVKDTGYRDEVLSKAPALADELAWCGIWEAVKRELHDKNPGLDVKSEEFLQKAGERFTEVITKTQVYDSVLSRSALMRSKDTGMKMATAFMAEPTTSINMIADALLKGKRGNKKYARAAIGAVIASQILNSILVSFVYAGRDDDEDETYVEKYIGTLTGEILDSLNPATYIPFIKDIVSIVQGYDVERSDMAVVSDLWNAWENLSKDNVSAYRKVEGFVGSVAQIFGLPVKNIMRDARGIYQTIDSFVNGQQTTGAGIANAIQSAVTGKDVSDQNQLYEAYLSGDQTQIARVKGRFKDQASVNSAIRKALRENDPRIKEAAQAKANGDLDEYLRLAKEIIAEKHFVQDDVVAAINAEINALSKGESSSGTQKESGMFKSDDFAVAISQGDNAMANAIKSDIIKTAQKNGKTAEEAEKSFINSATSSCKELFDAGEMSESEAVNALTNFCGKTAAEAESKVQYWVFKQDYPDVYVDDAWIDEYCEEVEPSGISVKVFVDYRNQVKGITGEEKKERRMAVIDSLPITSAQKDALYYAEGWTESKLYEAPWH